MYLNKLFIYACSIFLLLSCNSEHKINHDLEDPNNLPSSSLTYDFCQDAINIPHPFKDQLDYYWQYKEYKLFTDAICYRKQNWPKEETAIKTGHRWITKYKIKEDSALFIRHLAGSFSYTDLFGKNIHN